jgi:hypothetical protein
MTSQETVEKGHLIFVTAFSGVMLPFPSKRFSIVDSLQINRYPRLLIVSESLGHLQNCYVPVPTSDARV